MAINIAAWLAIFARNSVRSPLKRPTYKPPSNIFGKNSIFESNLIQLDNQSKNCGVK